MKNLLATVTLSVCLLAAHSASALLQGPYTADPYTLHLWHLDETTTPCIDSVPSGGTNLVDRAGGATLGNASFAGFGNALNTAAGGAGKGDTLAASPTAGNVTITVADPVTGAFTFEALVQIQFDPTATSTSAYEIMACESGANGNRIFQWRIAPKGFALIAGTTAAQPYMTFENIRAVSGNQNTIYAPIPTTGPDAIVSNGWYHVAVTYNGHPSTANNIIFYWTAMNPTNIQDDALTITSAVTQLTGLNPLSTITSTFMLGNQGRSLNGNFLGSIDEVRISKVARGPFGMMFGLPVVTLTPLVSQYVQVGSTINLSSLASGGLPISYRWQLNGTNINGALYTNISGITTNSLIISNVTFAEAGVYTLVAANSSSTNSSSATVGVGSPVPGLFNTGLTANGALQSPGLADGNWHLVQSPDPAFPGPAAIVDSSIPTTYLPDGPNSQWISPGDNNTASVGGYYEYATTFYLDSQNLTNMQMVVSWAADNVCLDLFLNGVDLGITNGNGFTALSANLITNNFVAGSNYLVCLISNIPGAGANLTAFRAELSALGAPLPPTALQILQSPTNFTANEYQNASFAVTAYGSGPVGYQWYAGNTLLAGQTGRTLTLTDVSTGQAGTYYVVVSNSLSTNTLSATLSVNVPDTLEWLGLTTADWDLSTTNWLDTTSLGDVAFGQGLNVLFDANGSAQPNVSLDVPLAPNSVVVNAANNYTFAGVGSLIGNFDLTVDGPGSLVVDNSGVNTYTGTTVIQGGTLQLGNYDGNGTLGVSVVSNNATLLFTTPNATPFPNSLTGTGTVAMNGTGTELLTGNNSTFAGSMVVSNGTLTPRSGTAFGNAGVTVLDNAQLFIDENINFSSTALTLGGFGLSSNPNGALHKGGAGASVLGGPITMTDAGGIGLDGSSSLTLSNAAAITAANLPFAFQLGASSAVTVAGAMNIGSGSFTLYGPATGTSSVTLSSASNVWTGGTTIYPNVTLQIGDGGYDGSIGAQPVTDNGTLTFLSSNNFLINYPISGTGGFSQAGGGRTTLSGNPLSGLSGAIKLSGNGELQLANGDSLTSGTLTLGAGQADLNRLELTGNNTVSLPITIFPRAFTGTILASPTTPPTNNPDIVNLSGTNTVAPTTPILIQSGGNLFCLESDSGYLIFNGGLTAVGVGRDFALQGPGNGEVDGPLTQNAGYSLNVYAVGSGTWFINGQNSYTGVTIVSNGVLVLNGTIGLSPVSAYGATLAGTGTMTGPMVIGAGATLAPTLGQGTGIGTMTVDNNLTLLPGSVTALQINESTLASDQITGMTNVILGGTLSITNLSGTLAAGDSFQLFNATSFSGAFSSITPATPGPGLHWDLSGVSVGGVLRVLSNSGGSSPTISTIGVSGGVLTLAGSGGSVGDTYVLLTSTNVGASYSKWTTVTNGAYGAGGSFTISIPAPTATPSFYVVESQ